MIIVIKEQLLAVKCVCKNIRNTLIKINYETAKFIKLLMDERATGKEIESLVGLKHSLITCFKRVINSDRIEDLKNASLNKVFKKSQIDSP